LLTSRWPTTPFTLLLWRGTLLLQRLYRRRTARLPQSASCLPRAILLNHLCIQNCLPSTPLAVRRRTGFSAGRSLAAGISRVKAFFSPAPLTAQLYARQLRFLLLAFAGGFLGVSAGGGRLAHGRTTTLQLLHGHWPACTPATMLLYTYHSLAQIATYLRTRACCYYENELPGSGPAMRLRLRVWTGADQPVAGYLWNGGVEAVRSMPPHLACFRGHGNLFRQTCFETGDTSMCAMTRLAGLFNAFVEQRVSCMLAFISCASHISSCILCFCSFVGAGDLFMTLPSTKCLFPAPLLASCICCVTKYEQLLCLGQAAEKSPLYFAIPLLCSLPLFKANSRVTLSLFVLLAVPAAARATPSASSVSRRRLFITFCLTGGRQGGRAA